RKPPHRACGQRSLPVRHRDIEPSDAFAAAVASFHEAQRAPIENDAHNAAGRLRHRPIEYLGPALRQGSWIVRLQLDSGDLADDIRTRGAPPVRSGPLP